MLLPDIIDSKDLPVLVLTELFLLSSTYNNGEFPENVAISI